MKAKISAIEYFLPGEKIGNDILKLENPDWDFHAIENRAGVIYRYYAGKKETALDLGFQATLKLFEKNPGLKDNIDAIIFCTQSPDYIMPSNSCILHGMLGLKDEVFAFDFNHACSGYVYGLTMASSFISSGLTKNILLITADTYSKYTNRRDRATRVLFGDGGCATWISSSDTDTGILASFCGTYGKDFDKFIIPAGGHRNPKTPETAIEIPDKNLNYQSLENIHMKGLEVLVFTNSKIPKQVTRFLEKIDTTIDQFDKIILHQASKVAIDSVNKILKIPKSKSYSNLRTRGNLVSSSIPVALKDAMTEGEIKEGDLVLLIGFGVGMSYGFNVVKF
jgi:3-oxoacyl-[acyl-carrier-protein] synthase III